MALAPAPEVNAVEAARFLRSYPGRPEYVICDGGTVWPLAVRLAWPDVFDAATGELVEASPQVLPCTWHLGGDLRRWLGVTLVATDADARLATPPPPDVRPSVNIGLVNKTTRPAKPANPTPGRVPLDDDHPLRKAANDALKDLDSWDGFYALAQQWRAEELLVRLGDGSDVRAMLTGWPPGIARSIGGLEAALRQIKRQVAYRSATLANIKRTQQLLMVMSIRTLAEERAYNRILHDRLLPAGGLSARQKAGVTGGARLQGVPTQRSEYQLPRLGPAAPYPRRKAVRRTPAGLRWAAARTITKDIAAAVLRPVSARSNGSHPSTVTV